MAWHCLIRPNRVLPQADDHYERRLVLSTDDLTSCSTTLSCANERLRSDPGRPMISMIFCPYGQDTNA